MLQSLKKRGGSLKIALCFAVVAALLTVTLVAIFAEDYTGTVDGINSRLVGYEDLSNSNQRADMLDAARDYANTVDPSAAGYAEANAKLTAHEAEVAKELLADCDEFGGSSSASYYIKLVRRFLKKHPYPADAADAAAFSADLSDAEARYAALMKQTYDELEKKVPITDYDYPDVYTQEFEGSHDMSVNNNTAINPVTVEKEADGNGYLNVAYGDGTSHTWVAHSMKSDQRDLVVEFDITTFTQLPSYRILFEHGSTKSRNGVSVFGTYFTILPGGKLGDANASAVSKTPVIVPGEWTHIAFVVEFDDSTIDVYVDGELLIENHQTCTTKGETYDFGNLRIGATKAKGSFALDNLVAYRGTAIRQRDKYDNMTDEQTFIAYSSVFSDDTQPSNNRGTAYKKAQELIELYFDGENYVEGISDELKAAVDAFNAFDYYKVMENYLKENWAEMKAMCDKLFAYELTPDTLSDRRLALASVDSFVEKMGDDIYSGAPEYSDYTNRVEQSRTRIAEEDVTLEFIGYMKSFDGTDDLQLLERYYDSAEKLVDGGINFGIADEPTYTDFNAAYQIYLGAGEKIALATRLVNSETFVRCTELLAAIDTENMEEQYEQVRRYVTYLRKILNEGEYDPDYIGFEAAMRDFEPYNAYIYPIIQQEHIEYISGRIDEFFEAFSYVEKMGIISTIERYVDRADIDLSDPDVVALLDKCDAIKAELSLQKEEYEDVLRQNTVFFINLSARLNTITDYVELRTLYDEVAVYYYAMNVDSAEAQAAIALYEAKGEHLAKIEETSMLFTVAVSAFGMDTYVDSMLYSTLVECAAYVSGANASIEGVSEAMEVYNAKYAEYSGAADVTNAELAGVSGAAVGERVGYVSDGFIAVIEEQLKG